MIYQLFAYTSGLRPVAIFYGIQQISDHVQHLAELTHLRNEVAKIPL